MMNQADYDRLKLHFEEKGLSIGAGIRMALYEYAKRERAL
jgi:hypothetical protein